MLFTFCLPSLGSFVPSGTLRIHSPPRPPARAPAVSSQGGSPLPPANPSVAGAASSSQHPRAHRNRRPRRCDRRCPSGQAWLRYQKRASFVCFPIRLKQCGPKGVALLSCLGRPFGLRPPLGGQHYTARLSGAEATRVGTREVCRDVWWATLQQDHLMSRPRSLWLVLLVHAHQKVSREVS